MRRPFLSFLALVLSFMRVSSTSCDSSLIQFFDFDRNNEFSFVEYLNSLTKLGACLDLSDVSSYTNSQSLYQIRFRKCQACQNLQNTELVCQELESIVQESCSVSQVTSVSPSTLPSVVPSVAPSYIPTTTTTSPTSALSLVPTIAAVIDTDLGDDAPPPLQSKSSSSRTILSAVTAPFLGVLLVFGVFYVARDRRKASKESAAAAAIDSFSMTEEPTLHEEDQNEIVVVLNVPPPLPTSPVQSWYSSESDGGWASSDADSQKSIV